MAQHRLISLIFYGAAALVGALLLLLTSYPALLVVGVSFVLAVAADRFINHAAEPDERMRSFVIYAVGMVLGLVVYWTLGARLGGLAFVTPLVGYGIAAIADYLKPPEAYAPRDPHRYGESPPVTVR